MTIGRLTQQLLGATSLEVMQIRHAPDGAGGGQPPKKRKKNGQYLALEPRMMFDGAIEVTAEAVAADMLHVTDFSDHHQDADTSRLFEALADTAVETIPADVAYTPEQRDIVFIDSAVADANEIANATPAGTEIVYLDADHDGLDQIAAYLNGRHDITAIHIVSHGEAGELFLGNAVIDSGNLAAHANDLAIIKSALSEHGDILLYGCDVAAGSDGAAFVEAIAAATGDDVAASSDTTGIDGNWNLERQFGNIEARSIAATTYQHNLVSINTIDAFVTVGSATTPSSTQIILTPNANNQVGAAMSKLRIDFSQDFTFNYDLNFGTNDANGADGIAFLFHNDPAGQSVTGQAGGALGIGGIQNSIAIKFDTFDNSAWYTTASPGVPAIPSAEIAQDFAVIFNPGSGFQPYGAYFGTNITAPVALNGGNIETGGWFPVQVNWNAATKTLSYSFNGVTIQSLVRDIVANDLHGNYGYFGFAASTGGYTNLQQVRNLSISGTIPPALDLDANNSSGVAGYDYKATFTENGAAVAISDLDTSVLDPLSTTLVSAEVQLTNAKAGDVLTVGTLPGSIVATVNTSAAGLITVDLTGTGTLAQYQTAIHAITFSNPSENPDATPRTIDVTVNDSTSLSNTARSTITVVPVNDAPVEVVPGAQTTNANAPLTISGVSVSDVDAGAGLETVTLSVTNGTLTLSSFAGLTFTTGDGTTDATMVFKGTIADINTAIAGLTYTPTANYTGAALLTFGTNDGGNTGGAALSDTKTIAISVVDVPPIAGDDTFGTVLNTAVTITELSNDTSPVGLPLTVTKINTTNITAGGAAVAVPNGTVSLSLAGVLTFTPTTGYSGPVTFDYTISDGHGGTDVGTITGGVYPPPVAVNDGPFVLAPNTVLNIDPVGANDSDPNGSPIHISAIFDPAAPTVAIPLVVGTTVTLATGTQVTLLADGTLDVKQSPNAASTEVIKYRITDDLGISATANITLHIDTDGDGIANLTDIDDDNDGILDLVENAPGQLDLADFTGWVTGSKTGTVPMPNGGTVFINTAVSYSPGVYSAVAGFPKATTAPELATFVGQSEFNAAFPEGLSGPTAGLTVWTNTNLAGPITHVMSVDFTNTALGYANENSIIGISGIYPDYLTVYDAQVTFTAIRLDGTVETDYTGWQAINPDAGYGGVDANGAILNTPLESATATPTGFVLDPANIATYTGNQDLVPVLIKLPEGSAYKTIIINRQKTGAGGDNEYLTLYVGEHTLPADTDADGLADARDLDSDNDGITDNVEAQTTAGYIAPSGNGTIVDTNLDGLDDVYDAGALGAAGGIGLTPVNTDGTDKADWRDTNSDNDALNDAQENGFGLPVQTGLSTAATDADGDGLFDVFESGTTTDGFDVNDQNLDPAGNNFNLPKDVTLAVDGSNAVPLSKDLLFRDLNVAPVAVNDGPILTLAGVTKNINVLGNDNDPDLDALIVTAIYDPAAPLVAIPLVVGTPVTFASGTKVTLKADGTLDVVQPAAAAETETFKYAIADGAGGTATATVTLTLDTDGDGVANLTDIDDDNDGVTDINEQSRIYSAPTNIITNGTFSGPAGSTVTSVAGWTLSSGNLYSAGNAMQFYLDGADQTLTQSGLTGLATGPGSQGAAQVEVILAVGNSGPLSSAGSGVTFEVLIAGTVYARVTTTNGQGTGTANSTIVYLNGATGTFNGSPTGTVNVGAPGATNFGTLLIDLPANVANTGNIQLHFNAPLSTPSDDVTIDNVRVLTSTVTLVLSDTDGDGVIDQRDLDSDNDGISDLYESTGGLGDALADTNNDGMLTAAESVAAGSTGDLDGDGLMDIADANTANVTTAASLGNVPINTDGDSRADLLDLDSDNDGIADTVEARLTAGYVANDGNVANDDSDGDGVINLFDTTVGFGGTFTPPVNTDAVMGPAADFLPDYLDLNSDGDAPTDATESGLSAVTTDANGDGIRDSVGASYADPDGIVNIPLTALADQYLAIPDVAYRESDRAPIALDDSNSGTEELPINGNVLTDTGGVDTDPDGDALHIVSFTIAGVMGVFAADTTATIPSVGTIIIAANGDYTFTPALNFNGAVPAITYTVADVFNVTDTGVLSLSLAAVNDAPVNTIPATYSVVEGSTLAVAGVSLAEVDAGSAPIQVTLGVEKGILNLLATVPGGVTAAQMVGNGTDTIVINATQAQINATLAALNGLTFTPTPGQFGLASLGILTEDLGNTGSGGPLYDLDSAIITIDRLPLPMNDMGSGPEDMLLSVPALTGLLANDTDPDGDTLTVTQFNVFGVMGPFVAGTTATIPSVGTLKINVDGSYDFNPALNYNGTVPTITYTVSDGHGGLANATLAITITPVNDNPVDGNETPITLEEVAIVKTPATGLLSNLVDVDGAAPTITGYTIAGVVGTPVLGTAFTIPTVGDITISADGSYTFTPLLDFNGPVPQITYTMSDGAGGSDTSTLDIAVTPVNDPPVDGNETPTTNEDTPLVVTATAGLLSDTTDVDGGTPTITSFTVPGLVGPQTVNVLHTIPGVGDITINSDGSYTFTPVLNFSGAVPQITYAISDGAGGTDTSTLDIAVTPVNDPPVLDLNGTTAGTGNTATFTENGPAVAIGALNATVTDVDDTVMASATIVISNLQPGDVLAAGALTGGITAGVYNPTTGTLTLTGPATKAQFAAAIAAVTYTTAVDAPNTTPRLINATVNDGTVDSNVAVATITVVAVNDKPVNTMAPAYNANALSTINLGGLAVADPDAGSANITVNFVVSAGTLTLDTTIVGGVTATQVTGNNTGSITITAPIAQINATIAALTGLNFNAAASLVPVTFAMSTNDLGNTGTGGQLTDFDVRTISMLPAVPRIDLDGDNSSGATGGNFKNTYVENALSSPFSDTDLTFIDNGVPYTVLNIVVSGVVDGANESVQILGKTFDLSQNSAQTVVLVNGTSLVTYVAATHTFTIANVAGGVATLTNADVTAVLSALTYVDQGETPTPGDRVFTATATNTDLFTTAPVTSTIKVIEVNDTPIVAINLINSGDVVVVDQSAPNAQQLVDALPPGTNIILIPVGVDGFQYLATALAGQSNISNLHILSHGETGILHLGTASLTAANAGTTFAAALGQIGTSLSATADILVYGCNFGQDVAAMTALANATNADIAASNDNTGAASLGGNWIFETAVGTIEATPLSLLSYSSLLAPTDIVTSGTFNGLGSGANITAVPGWTFATNKFVAVSGASAVYGADLYSSGTAVQFYADNATQSLTQSGLTGLASGPSQFGAGQIIISLAAGNSGPASSAGGSATFEVLIGTTPYARIVTTAGQGSGSTVVYLNGASGTWNGSATGAPVVGAPGSANLGTLVIDLPSSVANSGALQLKFIAGNVASDDFTVDNVRLLVNRNVAPAAVVSNYTGTEDHIVPITGVSFSDPEGATGNVTVTLNVGSGTLDISTLVPGGVTAAQVSGDNSGTITITAPISAINATLAATGGLNFTPTLDFVGTVPLTTTINDLGNGDGGATPLTATANATITILADTAGDGVSNAIDIDDDNDGVLDTVEDANALNNALASQTAFRISGLQASPGTTGQIPGSIAVANLIDNATGLVVGRIRMTLDSVVQHSHATTVNWVNFSGQPGLLVNTNGDTGTTDVESAQVKVEFLSAIDSIATLLTGAAGTALPSTFAMSFADIDGTAGNVEGIAFQADEIAAYTVEASSTLALSTTALPGQLLFSGTVNNPTDVVEAAYVNRSDITVNFRTQNGGAGFVMNLLGNATFSSATTTGVNLDSDADGVNDSLDIDSDNDGITDNVEAQTTAGYIAPTGDGVITYANGDGLDDKYDAGALGAGGGIGLTPVDTDGTDAVDYLDADSDNDGKLDITERGDGQATSVTSTIDTDHDGLLDIFEAGTINDGFDVNDANRTATTLNLAANPNLNATGSNAVPLTQDLLFRNFDHIPLIDLNSTASTGDTSRNNTATFTEGDVPVHVANITLGDVNDGNDGDVTSLTIVAGSNPDGTAERIVIAGLTFDLATTTTQTATIGGTTVDVAYDATTKSFTVTNNAGSTTPMAQADLDALVRGVTYENTSQNPTAGTRTLTFSVTDLGGQTSPPAVATLTIVAVNDAPTLDLDNDDSAGNVGTGYETTYTENGAGLSIGDVDVVVADVDNTTQQSATIILTDAQAGDLLTAGTMPAGIVASTYNPTTHTITLTGSATLADYQTAIKAISFSNTLDNPSAADRHVTVQTNDGALDSNLATTIIHVTPVNDQPLIDLNSAATAGDAARDNAVTFTEGDAPVKVAMLAADVNDFTENDVTALTIVAGSNPDGTAEKIVIGGKTFDLATTATQTATVGGTTVTIAYDATTQTFTVTNAAGATTPMAQADLDTLVRGVTYENTSEAPTAGARTLSFTVTDAANVTSPPAVATVTIVPVNDQPLLDLNSAATTGDTTRGNAVTFTEGDAPLKVALLAADVNDFGEGDITSLTIVAGSNPDGTAEKIVIAGLTFDLATTATQTATIGGTTVDVAYDATTKTFTVTNNAGATTPMAQADLDALIRGVTYENASDNPTGGNRTLTFSVTDSGGSSSLPAVATITVIPVDDAPVETLPATVGVAKNGTVVLTGVGVTDPDANSGLETVTLSVGHGTLTLGSIAGLTLQTGTGTNDTIVTFKGTLADINAAIAALTYKPTIGYVGSDTLNFTTNDNGNTGIGGPLSTTKTVNIDVWAPPVAINDTFATLPATSIVIDPLFNDTDVNSFPLTVVNVNGAPIIVGTPVPVTDGTVTLDATGHLTFVPTPGFSGPTSFTYTVDDGHGGQATATINGTVYSPPVLDADANDSSGSTGADYQTTYVENAAGISVVDADVTITDVDSTTMTSAKIVLTNAQAADLLALGTLPVGIMGTIETSVPGVVTVNLTGTDTLAHYQTAIAAVTFRNTSEDPNATPRVLDITVTDDKGAVSNTAVSTITVTPVNDAPIDGNELVDVTEDIPLTVPAATGLLANVVDPDGATPVITGFTIAGVVGTPVLGTAFTIPGKGDITIFADGGYTFAPFSNYAGPVPTITYTVSDGAGGTDTSTLDITVTPVNDPAVVIDPANPGTPTNPIEATDPNNIIPDITTADGATPSDPNIAQYFVDPDGNLLTFTATGLPPGLTMAPNGTITGSILPNASQNASPGQVPGTYLVTITADDGQGGLTTTTVTYTVTNPPPVAIADVATLGEDAALTVMGNVISGTGSAADHDTLGDADVLHVSAVGGITGGAIAGLVGQPVAGSTGGTFVVNTDGTWTFNPGLDFQNLNASQTRDTVIKYVVADGQGGFSEATVTVTVTGSNDAPVSLGPIAPVTGVDGQPVAPINAGAAFSNPTALPLTYTATGLPDGLSIDPTTGIISGTLANNDSVMGPYVVNITAIAPDGSTATIPLEIIVTNPAPTTVDDHAQTPLNTAVTIAVLGNDTDPDSDPLTVTGTTVPAHGTVVVNPDGTIDYTPTTGYTGPDTFTYTVSDGQGGISTATVTVNVGAPDPVTPTATPLAPATGIDGLPITAIDLTASFIDPNGDPLTFTTTGLPPGLSLDPTTGQITGILPSDASTHGPYTVYVTAADPAGNQVTTPMVIVVTNPAPTAVDDQSTTLLDTPVTLNIVGNDTDPDHDPLAVTAVTQPAHGTVVINPDGTVTYTPTTGYIGPDTFTYTVSDGQGGLDTATVTIDVGGTNPNAPTALAVPAQSGVDGTLVSIDVPALAGVTDPNSDPLVYSAVGLPPGLSIDPITGIISGTLPPATSANGSYQIEVYATDPTGATIGIPFLLTVTNPVPTASNDLATTVVDQPVNISVLANDHDDDAITVTATTTPAHGSLVINPDGTIKYTPSAGYIGPDTFTYTITDAQGLTNTATVTVDVGPATGLSAPPAVTPITGVDGQPISPLSVTELFVDPEAGVLTIAVDPLALPPGVTFNTTTNQFEGTPSNSASQGSTPGEPTGTYIVPVTATDSSGLTTTQYVTFTFTNLPPVAVDDVATVTEDIPVSGNVLTDGTDDHDTAPDSDPLVVTSFNIPGVGVTPAGSTATIPGVGTLKIGTDGAYTFTPAPNYDGAVPVATYTISDGQGGTDEGTLALTITPVNDAPVVVDPANPGTPLNPIEATDPQNIIPDVTTTDGATPAVIDASLFFVDPEGDTLSFTATDLPPGLTMAPDGTISGVVDPAASQGSSPGQPVGTYLVTITADDGQGHPVTTTVTYTITNLAPVAVDDMATVTEDIPVSGNVLTDGTDDHDTAPDSDPLVVSGVSSGTLGQPIMLTYGTLVLNATGTYTFTPNATANALAQGVVVAEHVTYTVSDGNGGTDTAKLTINITGLNDAPVSVMLPNQSNYEGNFITINPGITILDPDGDPKTFTATGLPPGLTIDPATGIITGTIAPGAASSRPYEITVTASDGHGGVLSTKFTWAVLSIPTAGPDPAPQPLPVTILSLQPAPIIENVITTAASGLSPLGHQTADTGHVISDTIESLASLNSAVDLSSDGGLITRLVEWAGRQGKQSSWMHDLFDAMEREPYAGDSLDLALSLEGEDLFHLKTVLYNGALYIGVDQVGDGAKVIGMTETGAFGLPDRVARISDQDIIVNLTASAEWLDLSIVGKMSDGRRVTWNVSINATSGEVVATRNSKGLKIVDLPDGGAQLKGPSQRPQRYAAE